MGSHLPRGKIIQTDSWLGMMLNLVMIHTHRHTDTQTHTLTRSGLDTLGRPWALGVAPDCLAATWPWCRCHWPHKHIGTIISFFISFFLSLALSSPSSSPPSPYFPSPCSPSSFSSSSYVSTIHRASNHSFAPSSLFLVTNQTWVILKRTCRRDRINHGCSETLNVIGWACNFLPILCRTASNYA